MHKTALFTIDRYDIDNERRTFSEYIKQAVSGQPGSKVACNHHDVTPSVQQYPVHQHIIGIMAPETPPCASWALHHPPAEVKRTE